MVGVFWGSSAASRILGGPTCPLLSILNHRIVWLLRLRERSASPAHSMHVSVGCFLLDLSINYLYTQKPKSHRSHSPRTSSKQHEIYLVVRVTTNTYVTDWVYKELWSFESWAFRTPNSCNHTLAAALCYSQTSTESTILIQNETHHHRRHHHRPRRDQRFQHRRNRPKGPH